MRIRDAKEFSFQLYLATEHRHCAKTRLSYLKLVGSTASGNGRWSRKTCLESLTLFGIRCWTGGTLLTRFSTCGNRLVHFLMMARWQSCVFRFRCLSLKHSVYFISNFSYKWACTAASEWVRRYSLHIISVVKKVTLRFVRASGGRRNGALFGNTHIISEIRAWMALAGLKGGLG